MKMRFYPAALLALSLLSGCYRYVPVERFQARPGSEVRAILTMEGTDELRATLGPSITSVDGPLMQWDSEGLSLLSDLTIQHSGFPATTMTDTLRLLPGHVARVEVRELDGRRTALFTAGVVGVAAAALIAPSLIGGESEPSGEGGNPNPDAAILLRIPIRIGWGGR